LEKFWQFEENLVDIYSFAVNQALGATGELRISIKKALKICQFQRHIIPNSIYENETQFDPHFQPLGQSHERTRSRESLGGHLGLWHPIS
jgi:hypothetical protein